MGCCYQTLSHSKKEIIYKDSTHDSHDKQSNTANSPLKQLSSTFCESNVSP